MRGKRLIVAGGLALAMVAPAKTLEKLALMDCMDMAYWTDIETKEGVLKLIDDCARPNSNGILWRERGRYPSREDMVPLFDEEIIDKRNVSHARLGSYWCVRLGVMTFDCIPFVFEECRRRKLIYGIHQTYEENHTCNNRIRAWTQAHPQFWNCKKGCYPQPGHASLAYPEVGAHKLRCLDEQLVMNPRPQRIFMDMWRAGCWTLEYEYVQPNLDKWNARHPGEPLPDWKDPRWAALNSEPMMAFLRAYGAKCHAAGCEFVIGLPTTAQNGFRITREQYPGREEDLNGIFGMMCYGIDWKQLAKEGSIDGIWIMDVRYDKKDVWGTLRKTLAHVKAQASGRKCYFGVDAYNYRNEGISTYAKNTGCTTGEVVRHMMQILTDLDYDGAVYECVDCHCYDKDACKELKKW